MRLIILFIALLHQALAQFLIVNTTAGLVQGALQTSRLDGNVTYYGFRGIPYAEPPVGALRFKPPETKTAWTGVHNATIAGSPCPQFSTGIIIGQEDCLHLDVYTAEIPTEGSALKPVMFWIHGGLFLFSGNSFFGADVLMKHDVVVVLVNYRLDVFGTLAVGTEAAWGNMVLKDQVMGLQWVHDNIAFFGGDPNRVTVFGQSAGAVSTNYLQLTPLATGLFQQIMLMSADAVTPWAFTKNPMTYAVNLATFFNISLDSPDSIVSGLQQIDYQSLLTASLDPAVLGNRYPGEPSPYLPVLEPDHPGAYFTQPGLQMFEAGNYTRVPYLFSYNTVEGSIAYANYFPDNASLIDLDARPERIVTRSLNGPDDPHAVGQIIKDFFVGANVSALDNQAGVLQILSQDAFVRSIRKGVELQRANLDGYLLRLSYENSAMTGFPGVDHGDDMQYYLYMPDVDYSKYTAQDFLTMDRMSKLYVNFATFGNPTPVADPLFNNVIWPKVTATDVGFLDVGVDLVPGSFPDETQHQFWINIFNTYGKPPFVTY